MKTKNREMKVLKVRSISTKLFVILLVSILVTSIAAIVTVYLGSSATITNILQEEIKTSLDSVLVKIEDCKDTSKNIADIIAAEPEFIAAVESGDKQAIINAANAVLAEKRADTEFVTITDANAVAIARTHSEKSGDSVSNQENVREALKGKGVSVVEKGTEVKLSVRSSAPVKNAAGEIIGAVSTGYKLDNTMFVDTLKKASGCDFTIFLGDERINTTIMVDGERQIGTKLDEKVAKIVLEEQKDFISTNKILGQEYQTAYTPIYNTDGTSLGILFAGKPIAYIKAREFSSIVTAAAIVSGLCVLLLIVSWVFMKKTIVNPVKELSSVATTLSEGQVNIGNIKHSSNDEIGALSMSIQKMAVELKRLLQEINAMTESAKEGDTDARVDVMSFIGAYRQAGEGINAIYEMSNGETAALVGLLSEFADGNFNADIPKLPGKKGAVNESVNNMRDNFKMISHDIEELVRNAAVGNMSVRSDALRFKGEWADIITELNALMERIREPISEAGTILENVAAGNFDKKILGDYKGDFLIIKKSVNTTVDNIGSYIREISSVLATIAENDFSTAINREYIGDFANIREAINKIIDRFNDVLNNISRAANEVASSSKLLSDNSQTLAVGSQEQATAIAHLNEMVIGINANTSSTMDNSKLAETLSHNSKENASSGDDDMNNMLVSMKGIKDSSNSISRIIKVIEDIAFQTNLLALNAAVVAARAGEHGKGFSVVAAEVRDLATRSQEAAKETADLIEQSIQRVDEGELIAQTTAGALKRIVGDVSSVSDIITSIAKSSTKQSDSMNEFMDNISRISDVVNENLGTSETTSAASQELASQAELLNSLVSAFKLKK